jgi:trans-aconitate 2-methyltransferase
MSAWSPERYLSFEEERTRPCRDLVANIRLGSARKIVDLGCGPGNSTAVLAERWPEARITGIDSSLEMLNRARQRNPGSEWVQSEIADWAIGSTSSYDLVFSNAALHWVQNHAELYPQLFSRVSPGGVLALQVPANLNEPAHQIMRDLASSDTWRSRLTTSKIREWFVHDPGFYYDLLAGMATKIDLWQTTYFHVMPTAASIAEWYRSTGLRPFLNALTNDSDRELFIKHYAETVSEAYPSRPNGRVLFQFQRLFLIASRSAG